jgi:hypothetical protein
MAVSLKEAEMPFLYSHNLLKIRGNNWRENRPQFEHAAVVTICIYIPE